jgi:hypothetical protein
VNKKFAAIVAAGALVLCLTACGSSAKTVGENVSKEADEFKVQRKIVGINGITNTIAFEVEGKCSIADQGHQLEVICRHGPDEYRKHMIGLSDNTLYVAEQLDPIDVSRYHTTIKIRPEALIPGFQVEAGQQ